MGTLDAVLFEQHYAYVNPILIIQVLNGTGGKLTDTNLDDCIAKIGERTGFKLESGQVVHTFGGTTASLTVNGLEVRYEEPSRIADDRNIRVVFFKEKFVHRLGLPKGRDHDVLQTRK